MNEPITNRKVEPTHGNMQVLAFACSPQWIEAAAPTESNKTELPKFSLTAYTGSAMQIAGWRHPVVVDLAGLNIPSQRRPIRLGHDAMLGVGHTQSVRIENGNLVAQGVVSRDTAAAREVVVSANRDFPWQCSIGASVVEHEFLREGSTAIVNGKEIQGPVNVVRRSVLGEISFVDLGADGNTSVIVANQNLQQSAESQSTTPFTKDQTMTVLQAAPTQPATPVSKETPMPPTETPAAAVQSAAQPSATINAVAASTPAPVVAAPAPATTVEAVVQVADLRAAAAAESERIAGVRKICAGAHADIETKAIREGWDTVRAELEVLRANRPQAPAAHVRQEAAMTGTVLEAACLLAGKHPSVEKDYDEKTLELASQRFRGGIGLQEMLLEAAWANGYTGRSFKDHRSVLRAAFAPQVQAAWSSIDIGGILSNVANKFLLDGFSAVEQVWRTIAQVGPVTDFKSITRYRLIGKDQYEKIAPGGEMKHGTLGEVAYYNQADTYGLMLSIDRRDIVNDDLGAITLVPRKLGRGAGLKINDVFWTTFLNHGAFFKAENNNLLTGADTALTIDGLTKAETAFLEQVDPDGKPLGLMPQILLLPPALSAIGTQLFKSVEMRDTSANAKYPIANPHQGKFQPVISRYLSNSQYPGASAKAWYLLCNPTDLPVIEVVFLNGVEAPTIETADADFSVLGIQLRGYHDFGVGLQEPRSAIKSKGEV